MKAKYPRNLLVSAAVVLGLLAAIWLAANPAQAALGNSGVPVRCTPSGSEIPIGEARFLECFAADDTPFTDGQRVPSGYYLQVTDIVVTSHGGGPTASDRSLSLYDAFGDASRAYALELSSTHTADPTLTGVPTFGLHFTTPYMVLPAGHRLEGVNESWSGGAIKVYVSGLLVTNVTYLPLASK
jgi:hypothetical protein